MANRLEIEIELDQLKRARARTLAELQEARAALILAERSIREMREIIDDFCIQNGARKSCCHCGQPVWWMHRRGAGAAVMYNPDLSEHWPRCAGMQRAAAGGAA